MNEFLKKLSQFINEKNPAYQNNQQVSNAPVNTSSTIGANNIPASVIPATTPISTNAPAATTPISTPVTARPTTPVSPVSPVSTAKTTAPRTTPTTANTPKIDPKSGVNGAIAFSDITAKKPTLGEAGVGKNDLIDAYNSGFNGTDLTKEAMENARAGNYMPELEAVYNAGKADANEKLAAQEKANFIPFKTPADKFYSEKFKDYPNVMNFAEFFKGDNKTVDNQGNPVYNPTNTTGNDSSNGSNSITGTGDGNIASLGDFQYPTADFSNVTEAYGNWYPDEEGYHMGVDIGEAGGKNSNIGAIYGGEVVFSGEMGKNGNIVIIKHTETINGEKITFYSSYSHLKEKDIIKKGAKVNAGDKIGIMGSTGNSTGPHLHLAIFTTTIDIDSLRPYGYGSYQISDYAWKSSSSGHTIYYDPDEVFKTNGAIIQDTLNAL